VANTRWASKTYKYCL